MADFSPRTQRSRSRRISRHNGEDHVELGMVYSQCANIARKVFLHVLINRGEHMYHDVPGRRPFHIDILADPSNPASIWVGRRNTLAHQWLIGNAKPVVGSSIGRNTARQ